MSARRGWRDWSSGEFGMRQGHRKGVNASIEILLPMAAAVIRITAIGIAFRLTEIGGNQL